MEISLQPIFFAVGMGLLVSQGLFLSLRKVPTAYRILGISFIIIGFNLFSAYLNQTGLMREYIHLFRSPAPTQYLFGPLGYLFVRFLIVPNSRWSPWDFLHFVPFVLHFIELIPVYSLPAADKQVLYTKYITGPLEEIPLGVLTFREHIILKALMVLAYQTAIFFHLRPMLSNWRQYRETGSRILIVWVLVDFIIKTTTFGSIFILYLFNQYFEPHQYWKADTLHFLDNAFCALFLLANPGLMQGFKEETRRNLPQAANAEKETEPGSPGRVAEYPEISPVKNPEFAGLIAELETLMQTEQPFLQEGLNLQGLSARLKVKPYRLSKAIKDHYGLSYSDYINGQRLNYIEEKIREDEVWKSYSIESMAFQAGFGSRAAFYLAFRKVYPGSPADYFGLKQSQLAS